MNPLLDLELLHTFTMIVQTGELKKAAHSIHRSHAAVSMQMKRLEEQLGCRLMTRSNRGIQLTDEGKTLLRYSEQLLQLNNSTVTALTTKGFDCKVRFGIPTDYAHDFLSHFMPLLTRELPNLEATIYCDRSRNLRRQLQAGELDIAIVAGEQNREGELLLWREQLIWCCTHTYRPAEEAPVAVAMLEDDCIVRDLCLQGLASAKLDYRQVFNSPVLENVATAVHAGFAISLLPDSLIDESRVQPFQSAVLPGDLTLEMKMIHAYSLDDLLIERISQCMRRAALHQQQSRQIP